MVAAERLLSCYKPVFDKRTGMVDKEVAQYRKENYDLVDYTQKN